MWGFLAVLAAVFLSYVAGAASIYFDIPQAIWVKRAFEGGVAWREQGKAFEEAKAGAESPQVNILINSKNSYGYYTLFCGKFGTKAYLINPDGKQVHEWEMPWSSIVPTLNENALDRQFHWERARLLPNGDLIVIYHTKTDSPYGKGIARITKDSELVWSHIGNIHHDMDIAENGHIFTLSQDHNNQDVPWMPEFKPPFLEDYIVELTADGKELNKISILEAFKDTSFVDMLSRKDDPSTRNTADIMHANSIRVLKTGVAYPLPELKPGQVLISMRHNNTIAVIDTASRKAVWAKSEGWHMQHNAEFLPNGKIALFDNKWDNRNVSRVVEHDLASDASETAYPKNEEITEENRISTFFGGVKQYLPNGGIFVLDSQNNTMIEAAPEGNVVWKYSVSFPSSDSKLPNHIMEAKRYAKDETEFLRGIDDN